MADPNTKKIQLKAGLRLKFEIPETDLDEQFVRGHGHGGQKVNKTSNQVVLKHLPTDEIVKSHQSREQHVNRALARKELYTRLDLFLNEETSKTGVKVAKDIKRKEKKEYRQRQKQSKSNEIEEAPEENTSKFKHNNKTKSQLRREALQEYASTEESEWF